MPTKRTFDDRLINKARLIGGHRTKKEAVTAALEESIRRREQLRILELAGKIDYSPGCDYKTLRQKEQP